MSDLPTVKVTYIVDTLLPEKTHDIIAIHAVFGEIDAEVTGSYAETILVNRWSKEVLSREKYSQTQQVLSIKNKHVIVPVSRFNQSQTLFPESMLTEILDEVERTRINHPLIQQIILIVTADNTLHNAASSQSNKIPIIHFSRSINPPQTIIRAHGNHSGIAFGYLKWITKKSQFLGLKPNCILAAPYHLIKDYRGKQATGLLVLKDQSSTDHHELKFKGPHLIVAKEDLQGLTDHSFISLNSLMGEVSVISKGIHQVKLSRSVSSALPQKIAQRKFKYYHELSTGNMNGADTAAGVCFLNAMELVRSVLRNHKSGSYTQALIDYILGEVKISPSKPIIYQSICVSTGTKNLFGKHGGQYLRESPDFFLEELEAIHQLLHLYNFSNITLSIPFIRTVKELEDIKRIISAHKLTRSPKFKLDITIQVPSNILQLHDYLDLGVDGVIIDLQCLTDLTLGIDSHLFHKNYSKAMHTYEFMDEAFRALHGAGVFELTESLLSEIKLDSAVKRIIEHSLEICQKRHTPLFLYIADTYEEEVEKIIQQPNIRHHATPVYA